MNRPNEILEKKLLQVLQLAFVNLRNLSLNEGNQELAELGDAFEIIPGLLANWDDKHLALIREVLSEFQEKHAESGKYYDFLSVLDTDDDRFKELYCQGW